MVAFFSKFAEHFFDFGVLLGKRDDTGTVIASVFEEFDTIGEESFDRRYWTFVSVGINFRFDVGGTGDDSENAAALGFFRVLVVKGRSQQSAEKNFL